MTVKDLFPNAYRINSPVRPDLQELTQLIAQAANLGITVADIRSELLALDAALGVNTAQDEDVLALASAVSTHLRELKWLLRVHERLERAKIDYEAAERMVAVRPRKLAISCNAQGSFEVLDLMVKHAARPEPMMHRCGALFDTVLLRLQARQCLSASVLLDAAAYFHLQETRLADQLRLGYLVPA
jgi:hypothetical protein